MLLIGLIVLLLGLGFVLLPCLQCVRASLTRAPTPMRVVLAPQVETIRTFFSEAVPVGGARVRALSTELFSHFEGDATRAPNLFLKKVASKSLVSNGNVGIGTTGPSYPLDISGSAMRVSNASGTTTLYMGASDTNTKAIAFNSSINSVAQAISIQDVGGAMYYGKAASTAALANGSKAVFPNAGSLNSGNPFWQGWQFTTGDVLTNIGVNVFPAASHFNSYTVLADPTDLYYNIQTGNSGTIPYGINLQTSNSGKILLQGGNVGIGFTSPFFLSPIVAIASAIKTVFQNFSRGSKRNQNQVRNRGTPAATPVSGYSFGVCLRLKTI